MPPIRPPTTDLPAQAARQSQAEAEQAAQGPEGIGSVEGVGLAGFLVELAEIVGLGGGFLGGLVAGCSWPPGSATPRRRPQGRAREGE